jgi:hypothetical protein
MVSPLALSAPLSDTVASPETALLAEFSVKELPEAHAQRRLPAIAVAMIVDIYFFIKISIPRTSAAQIVMKVFHSSTLCFKIVCKKLYYKAREEEL